MITHRSVPRQHLLSGNERKPGKDGRAGSPEDRVGLSSEKRYTHQSESGTFLG